MTISLMALCAAAWIATLVAHVTMDVLPQEHYRERAFTFWEDHPYLEPDEALVFYILERDRPELFQNGAKPSWDDKTWEIWLKDRRLRASFSADSASGKASERERVAAELERVTRWGFYLPPDEVPPEGGYPTHRFGLVPAQPTWYGFVTHMFMHASWAHILGNLFLFFIIAPAMEDRWGRPLFAGFYMTAGIFAGGFFSVLSLGSPIPLVGASGAIAGVLGSFLVLYWKTKIKFMYFFFLPRMVGTFRVAAWVVLPLWLANEMLGAFLTDSAGIEGGVAYWAHVGGFLFGSAFALCVRGFRLEEKYLAKVIDRKVNVAEGRDIVLAARRALDDGIFEEAFILYQQESANRPDDLDSVLGYWEAAVAFHKPDEGAKPLLSWIRAELARDRGKQAAGVWCRAIELEAGFPVDGPTLIKLVPLLQGMGRRNSAVSALGYLLSSSNPSLNAAMALQARQIAAELDPATELLALHRVLALAELPVEKEERLRERVAELAGGGVVPCCDPFGLGQPEPGDPTPGHTQAAASTQQQSERRRPEGKAPTQDPRNFDGRAIEIDLEEDAPHVAPQVDAGPLPPAVEAPDMSYFGENSADNEPLGLAESMESASSIGQPLEGPSERKANEPAVAAPSADLDVELGGPVTPPRFRDARRSEVVPVELGSNFITLQTEDGNLSKLELRRIQAVACAVVEDVSAKPILIVDLLLNWHQAEAEVLQVVRMRSNSFDARVLMPNSGTGMEALRDALGQIQRESGADPLPSQEALAGQPFARFGRLVDYEREVLDVAIS